MPLRNAAEFPKRFLNACAECFKGFRKTQRHTFHIAVRQHAVKECVLKSPSGNLHTQFVADGEVTGDDSPRVMLLIEEHRFPGTMQTPPLSDTTLQSTTRGIGELSGMLLLQPFQKCFCFEPWFQLESLLNLVPDIGERILSRTVSAGFLLL